MHLTNTAKNKNWGGGAPPLGASIKFGAPPAWGAAWRRVKLGTYCTTQGTVLYLGTKYPPQASRIAPGRPFRHDDYLHLSLFPLLSLGPLFIFVLGPFLVPFGSYND